jgi:hypothetical protein
VAVCLKRGIVLKKEDPVTLPLQREVDKFVMEKLIQICDWTDLENKIDAKYEPADLDKIARNCDYLTDDEQMQLLSLLHKYQHLFDGSLGTWNDKPYDIELKPDAKPYHSRPFPVPKIHEATLKIELECLTKAGVLKKVNRSEWAAPTFLIPKKDAMV